MNQIIPAASRTDGQPCPQRPSGSTSQPSLQQAGTMLSSHSSSVRPCLWRVSASRMRYGFFGFVVSVVVVIGFWFWFWFWCVGRSGSRLLAPGLPRARRRGSIDAGESDETRGEYRTRRAHYLPRDFPVADSVETFHGLEKAGDSRMPAAVASATEEAKDGFHLD